LPFCHITFQAKKPDPRKYPDVLRTWGDHIKARRLDLKLTKRQLSLRLDVSDLTIYLWEKNQVEPSLGQVPIPLKRRQIFLEREFGNIGGFMG